MLVFPMLSDFHPFIKDFGISTDTYVDPCTFHFSILWTVRPPLFLNVSQIIVMLLPVRPARYPIRDHKPSGFTEGVY